MAQRSKGAVASRREAAVYRRTLDEVLKLAINRLLLVPHDAVAWQVTEIVSPVLREKRPAGAGA